MSDPLALMSMSAAEAALAIARREISPVDLVRAHFERVELLDPAFNCFLERFPERALAEAETAEAEIAAGRRRGPLHGIPIPLKDIFDVAGQRTAAASKILAERIPGRDAHVVSCLKRAGAILTGRLNMHEFAYGLTTTNPHYGPCRNPWNLERVPGGSSGGSGAALAAGMCVLSLGTDTGGSIRIPAAACGVVGLKPTFGRVSRRGVLPLSWALDHAGPMARNVADLALLLEAISEPDPEDAWCANEPPFSMGEAPGRGASGITIGIPRPVFFEDLDPDVERVTRDAIDTLEALGARRLDVELTHVEHAYTALHAILASEAAAYHRRWLTTRPGDYGEDVRRGLEIGSLIPAMDYVDARRLQALLREEFAAVLERVDVMVTPTLPRTAPRIGEPMTREPKTTWSRLVAPFNLVGIPALSLPCGFDREGLPIGLQIAGRWFDEETVLRTGHAYEQATDWHRRRPPEASARVAETTP